MTIFIYHPTNEVAKKIEKETGVNSFFYVNRAQMEATLREHLKIAGVDIWPQFHCQLGSLAGTVREHMKLDIENNKVHAAAVKIIESNKTPWSYVKINNGAELRCVIGYCNSDPSVPFLFSNAQMAQKGLVDATFVPELVG